jgi:hypothetical protein
LSAFGGGGLVDGFGAGGGGRFEGDAEGRGSWAITAGVP